MDIITGTKLFHAREKRSIGLKSYIYCIHPLFTIVINIRNSSMCIAEMLVKNVDLVASATKTFRKTCLAKSKLLKTRTN